MYVICTHSCLASLKFRTALQQRFFSHHFLCILLCVLPPKHGRNPIKGGNKLNITRKTVTLKSNLSIFKKLCEGIASLFDIFVTVHVTIKNENETHINNVFIFNKSETRFLFLQMQPV